MNKIFAFLLIASTMAGCCTSNYCDPQRPIKSFNDIVVRQITEGSKNTAADFRGMGHYFLNDLRTAGKRMRNTSKTIYDGISFSKGANMGKTLSVFTKQIKEGSGNIVKDLRAMASAACIGGM